MKIHCSGHAKGEDLLQVVKEIDAKMLYPIHTEHPTEYVKVTRKMTIEKVKSINYKRYLE